VRSCPVPACAIEEWVESLHSDRARFPHARLKSGWNRLVRWCTVHACVIEEWVESLHGAILTVPACVIEEWVESARGAFVPGSALRD
jgi:hypothetical protein